MSEGATRILIVDDEPDLRTYLSTLLEDEGYVIETASDGEEGLAAVRASPPDLITLDVNMPNMSGVRLYRILKESDEWSGIPVVIVTGMAAEFKDFISSRRSVPKPEGYLYKPPDPSQVVALVRKLTRS